MGAGKKWERFRVPFGLQNHLSSGARLGHELRLQGKWAEGLEGPGTTFTTGAWTPEGAAGATCDPEIWGPLAKGGELRPEATTAAEAAGNPSTTGLADAPTGKTNSPTWSSAARPWTAATAPDEGREGRGGKLERSIDPTGSGSEVGAELDEGGAAAAGPAPADLQRP
jgi:hypothetical protein